MSTNAAFVALNSSPKMKLVLASDQPQIPEQLAAPCQKQWVGYFEFKPENDSGNMTIEVGADDNAYLTVAQFPDTPVNVEPDPTDPNGGGTYRTASHTFENASSGFYLVNISYTNVSGVAQNLSQLTVKVNGAVMQIGSLEENSDHVTHMVTATYSAKRKLAQSGLELTALITVRATCSGEKGEAKRFDNLEVVSFTPAEKAQAMPDGRIARIVFRNVRASFAGSPVYNAEVGATVQNVAIEWDVESWDPLILEESGINHELKTVSSTHPSMFPTYAVLACGE